MNVRTACPVLALAALCGCATAPELPHIRAGESVAFMVAMSPQASGAITIRNDTLGSDTSTGLGSGMLAGGLWGLACGPFIVLCVPLGAAAGAITGTAAGAAVGLTGVLPESKATLLRDRMLRLQQSHAMLTELQTNIADRARKYWDLGFGQAANVVTVELQDLLLASTRDERIRCAVRALVSVQPSGEKRVPTPKPPRLYEYLGPYSTLTVWLDEGSDFADTCLTSASQQIAAQIVSDLAVK